MTGPQSKPDLDRLRQRAASERKANRALFDTVVKLLVEYDQGRAASSCMDELKRLARAG